MKMEIIISKEPEDLKFDEKIISEIKNAIEIISELYDLKNFSISITLTTDEIIHSLNKNYRGIDRPTDVLSFAFHESDEPQILNSEIDELGDIIISVERAKIQSEDYGHSFKREIIFLTVHGMLHLLGYDHIEESDRIEMESEQKFIMERLGINR